jgi:hypothetical protein
MGGRSRSGRGMAYTDAARPAELCEALHVSDLSNGFLNRFPTLATEARAEPRGRYGRLAITSANCAMMQTDVGRLTKPDHRVCHRPTLSGGSLK